MKKTKNELKATLKELNNRLKTMASSGYPDPTSAEYLKIMKEMEAVKKPINELRATLKKLNNRYKTMLCSDYFDPTSAEYLKIKKEREAVKLALENFKPFSE